jgi:hypothetical protein
MSNEFRGEGNLGVQPTLRKVMVDDDPHTVAELRIFFDRFKVSRATGRTTTCRTIASG